MKRLAPQLAAAMLLLAQPLVPALAQSQQITPSHLQAARAVVIGSGIERSFDAVVPSLFNQVREQLVTRPELTKDMEEIIVKISPELEARKSEMVDQAARIYASQISEADLKDIGAFFSSPAGKRYVTSQPAILQELFLKMQDWQQSLSAAVVERIRAEMRARGKDF